MSDNPHSKLGSTKSGGGGQICQFCVHFKELKPRPGQLYHYGFCKFIGAGVNHGKRYGSRKH